MQEYTIPNIIGSLIIKLPSITGGKPRVDLEALKMAFEFQDACNPFLRAVSRVFIEAVPKKRRYH